MAKTKKKKASSAEMDELRKIYKEAENCGIFVREFKAGRGCFAVAGSIKRVEELEKKLGVEFDIGTFTLGNCFEIGAIPDTGRTRAEACRNAVGEYKKVHNIK